MRSASHFDVEVIKKEWKVMKQIIRIYLMPQEFGVACCSRVHTLRSFCL